MIKQELVFKIVSSIPKGKVATYGQVAKIAGIKNPRSVGSHLHKNKDPENIPCHRVVDRDGRVADNYAFGGSSGQIKKLEKEGVGFIGNAVDLSKYIWKVNEV